MESVQDLKKRYRRGAFCKIAERPQFSSLDARLYAGQAGRIYAAYAEDDTLLVAVLIPRAVTWVDHRDLEITG